jgi:hypothetical protein
MMQGGDASRFTVSTSKTVQIGEMPRDVTFKCQTVDAAHFFHLSKSDPKVANVLLANEFAKGKVHEPRKLLGSTDIVERIVALRDAQFRHLLGIPAHATGPINYRTKATKRTFLTMPEVMNIMVQGVGDIAPRSMKALCSKPSTAVHIELNVENMCFLADVVSAQLAAGGVREAKRAREIVGVSGVHGVPYDGSKTSFFVRYGSGDADRSRKKYFSVKKLGLQDAKESAIRFIRDIKATDDDEGTKPCVGEETRHESESEQPCSEQESH